MRSTTGSSDGGIEGSRLTGSDRDDSEEAGCGTPYKKAGRCTVHYMVTHKALTTSYCWYYHLVRGSRHHCVSSQKVQEPIDIVM